MLSAASSRFCDHRLHLIILLVGSFERRPCVFQSWIYRVAAKCCGDWTICSARIERATPEFSGTIPAGLNLLASTSSLLWTLHNCVISHSNCLGKFLTILSAVVLLNASVGSGPGTVSFNILLLHVFRYYRKKLLYPEHSSSSS